MITLSMFLLLHDLILSPFSLLLRLHINVNPLFLRLELLSNEFFEKLLPIFVVIFLTFVGGGELVRGY